MERVHQLKTENELLEEKINMLTKELGFLKDLFLAHAGEFSNLLTLITKNKKIVEKQIVNLIICIAGSTQHSINFQDLDLNAILADESKMDLVVKSGSSKS